jgi:sigma-E factor negative regulatory protein RseB
MKLFMKVFLLVYLATGSYAHADEQSMDLLKKINNATNTVNYDGVFIHIDASHVHTMRVVHKVEDGSVRERLYSLNGIPREVIRDAERVWCFMPEKKMGHAGLRSNKETGFPGFMLKSLSGLSESYLISTDGVDRIADRPVQGLHIKPRDDFRFGYELWADKETGLLLKTALIDHNGKTIEQYMFAVVTIGGDIPETALLPMTKKDTLEWHSNKVPPESTAISDSRWQFTNLPSGYRLVNVFQRSMPMGNGQIQHMILSDGLAGVSVFVEKVTGSKSDLGSENMGAVNSYTRQIGDFQITVIGEARSTAITAIANALVSKH